MKNILKYGLLGLGVVATTSCIDTMDTKPMVSFDAETVWGNKKSVEGFIYAAYNDIIENAGYASTAGANSTVRWESFTPNSVHASKVPGAPNGNGDTFPTELGIGTGSDYGVNRFGYLRRANMIIENVENSSTLTAQEKTELKAHGYLLRGLIFFDQARKMGRFVPITEVFDQSDSLTCLVPMTKTPTESYKYVIDDLKYASENLPESALTGVPTKWAAKVLLSRAALQAYAYTNDKNYIEVALNAAKEVIENKGNLLSTSQGMFNELDATNAEILWGYYREKDNTPASRYWELIATYPNISEANTRNCGATPLKNPSGGQTFEGWATFFPTQDLVDQFLVIDNETEEALPWYETSQWKNNVNTLDPATITQEGQIEMFLWNNNSPRRMPCPSDFSNTHTDYPIFTRYATLKSGSEKNISQLMYENRDKRFYTAIAYDQCTWMGEEIETCMKGNLYRGVRDEEDGGWYNTVTNYYWRKSSVYEPDPRAYGATPVAHHFNLARVGEAYMNLAEAYLLKEEVALAVEALNRTREVHGGLPASKATTLEAAWADYIRERNCEMCNEGGDLYFSYLRWGKYGGYANYGEEPGAVIKDLNRPVHMIQIDSKRETILVNQVTMNGAAKRVFSERRYLLPISQNFLNTREAYGLNDAQNTGW